MKEPRTVDKFKDRHCPVTVTPSAKTQPVAGDGVSGGPGPAKSSGVPRAMGKG